MKLKQIFKTIMKFPQDIYANRQLIKLDMPLVWHEESFISQWCVKIYQNPEEIKLSARCSLGIRDWRILCLLRRILRLTFNSLGQFLFRRGDSLCYTCLPLLKFVMKTLSLPTQTCQQNGNGSGRKQKCSKLKWWLMQNSCSEQHVT